MTTAIKKSTAEIRTERLSAPAHSATLLIACLWPKNGQNLGTTLRTCDAVGASLVVPKGVNATKAIRRGNTIGVHNSPVIEIDEGSHRWLYERRSTHRIIGVELAHRAIPLRDLAPADGPTIAVLGHEVSGIPQAALHMCDEVVEIPMEGVGNSLNASVAAALVLYKLKGWI